MGRFMPGRAVAAGDSPTAAAAAVVVGLTWLLSGCTLLASRDLIRDEEGAAPAAGSDCPSACDKCGWASD